MGQDCPSVLLYMMHSNNNNNNNILIYLIYIIGLCRDGSGCWYTIMQRTSSASVEKGFESGELNWRGASMDHTPDSANRSST